METVPGMTSIVPAGELDGPKDRSITRAILSFIVPAGELDGPKDLLESGEWNLAIVPAGELDGPKDDSRRPDGA